MEDTEVRHGKKPEFINVKKDWVLNGAKGRKGRRIVSLLMKPGALEAHNLALKKKYDLIAASEIRSEVFNCEAAEYLVVAFGTVARIAKGTVEMAKDLKLGVLRPITLWPFPAAAIRAAAAKAKKVFVFEMNMGQMVEDVRLAIQDDSKIEFYGRPGGGVPTSGELLSFIRSKIK
jgi:2-oxoglutarate/2-oxoacid ferredoxin oxidoreductase subunit alpha